MRCTNPKMKKLIAQYQFGLLADEQKILAESHLLECDACFQETYHISPALSIFENHPEELLTALEEREKSKSPFVVKKVKLTQQLIDLIGGWLAQPAVKILVPVAVLAILALFLFWPASIDYTDLAIIQKADYLTVRYKSELEQRSHQELFEKGMSCYQSGLYAQAIRHLENYVIQDSLNTFGHFYLGVAYLLTDQIEPAIHQIKKANQLSVQQNQTILSRRCNWYLGNAYLRRNQVEQALEVFQKLTETPGIFDNEARSQIAKINERKNKS